MISVKFAEVSPMSCESVVPLPGGLRHEEARIDILHTWIETLCDPGSSLITELNNTVRPVSPSHL